VLLALIKGGKSISIVAWALVPSTCKAMMLIEEMTHNVMTNLSCPHLFPHHFTHANHLSPLKGHKTFSCMQFVHSFPIHNISIFNLHCLSFDLSLVFKLTIIIVVHVQVRLIK
jgi:hypothetical protein